MRTEAISQINRSNPADAAHLRQLATMLRYGMMTVLLIIYLVPIFWIVSSSFRTDNNMYATDQWIPNPLTTEHYVNIFEFVPNWTRLLLNTVVIAVAATIGRLLSCSMAGYALARMRFPGRGVLMLILLLTLMVPGQVTLVPIYVMFRQFGWLNTSLPLIVPAFFGGAFATFFFRQFFLGIPREVEEAAVVDGASRWRVYWSIVLPMSRPAIATMGILTFLGAWNDYFGASVYLRRQESWVLTQGLTYLTGRYNSEWGEIMAGVVLMSLPMVVLYLIGQKYFLRGLGFTGVKG